MKLNDRLMSRNLKGLEKAIKRYYENKRTSTLNVSVYEEAQFTCHNLSGRIYFIKRLKRKKRAKCFQDF